MSPGGAGILLLALSASAYGSVPIFARLYYEAGGTPLAMLAFRYGASALLLAAALPLLGRAWRLGRWGVAVGALLAVVSYGYLAAVRFIPVSVAALVFFTYPMLTVLTARLLGVETVGWRRGLGVVAAFVGLALGLDVAPGIALAPGGLALAGLAAIAYTALLLVTHRAAQSDDGTGLTFAANLVAALLFLPLAWAAGETALPVSGAGWGGLLGVTLAYLVGILSFIAGLARSGAIRAAALSNLEPVVTIAGAVALLGETLTLVQLLGILLLAGGILAMSR